MFGISYGELFLIIGATAAPIVFLLQDLSSIEANPSAVHSQAITYARIAETTVIKSHSPKTSENVHDLTGGDGLPSVLPISAESAGLLPKHNDDMKGSDIVLEAILEAEVAHNAKHFFSLPENQVSKE